jgi:hypothetical protein
MHKNPKSFTHSFHFGSTFCTGFISTFRLVSEEEPTFTQCRVHIEAAIKGIGPDGQPEPSSLLGKSLLGKIFVTDIILTALSDIFSTEESPVEEQLIEPIIEHVEESHEEQPQEIPAEEPVPEIIEGEFQNPPD